MASAPVADTVLPKRQSRPPQRLTAAKLGTVSSGSDKDVVGLVAFVADSTESTGASAHLDVQGSGVSAALGSSVVDH